MKFYSVNIGTEKMIIKAKNLIEAKNISQWLKFKYNYKGKTLVKLLGYHYFFNHK